MPSGDTRARLAAVIALTFAGSLLFVAYYYSDIAKTGFNTDVMLPADFVHHVFVAGLPWQDFQLPRIPSFVPDLMIYVPLHLITGWRIAFFLTVAILLCLLLVLGGTIAARVASAPASTGIATFSAIALLILLFERSVPFDLHVRVLHLVSHGGSFIATLLSVLIADRLRQRFTPLLGTVLFALVLVFTISSRLYVLAFALPILVALFAPGTDPRARRAIIAVVVAGTIIGWLGGSGLFLNRQPDTPLEFGDMLRHARRLIFDRSFEMPLTMAISLLFVLAPLLERLYPKALRPASDPGWFYWVFALVAMATTFAVTAAFLWEDLSNIRYVATMIWWPVIFVAAFIAIALRRVALISVAGLVAAVAALGATVIVTPSAASLWRWSQPAADCLLADATAPREGLAGFWQARMMEASSDWVLQVDQIMNDGRIYLWGNDPGSYERSRLDPSRPPQYRFIVMAELDPAKVAARFGEPSRRTMCGKDEIWLYDAPVPAPAP